MSTKPSKEDLMRFNYDLNFTVIPELVKGYNNNPSADAAELTGFKCPDNVSKQVSALYRQIKTIESGINGHPGISLILVEMPNYRIMTRNPSKK